VDSVAIGSAVDDAIVDAENVYRCLRENTHPIPALLDVVFEGQEVRGYLEPQSLQLSLFPIFAL